MSINKCARDFALFMLYILIFSLPCIFTAPTVQTPYAKFFANVTSHKCYLPKEITPFSPSALGWFFLNEPLKQCDSNDANFEATTLCAEIFENLINTTCSLDPTLSITKGFFKLSSNVCTEFANSNGFIPKIENYFGGKLSDNTVCLAVCSPEYKILCEVLLWSYQVRHHIETAINAANSQNKIEPVVKSVPGNQNDLASNVIPEDEVEDPPQSQNEMNPVGNPNVVSSAPITAETSDKTPSKSNVQSEIAKAIFESERRLIPNFSTKDGQGQPNKETQAEEPVETISSTKTNVSTAGPSEKSSNVQEAEDSKIANQLENVKTTQLSSKNEATEHTIEETSEKNQLITSNAKNTAAKTTKQDMKAKLREKLFKKTVALQLNTTSSPSPETNVGNDIAAQIATKEKLSNTENTAELKDKSVQNNEMVSVKENQAVEPVHETPETNQAGANVEEVRVTSGKDVLSLDTVHNTEKDARQNLNASSTASDTNVGKASGQDIQQLSDSQDNLSSNKIEVKTTVEIQGKDTDVIASESTDLEATTLEVTLEEMDDANEVPPPVQEQDQYNLENGDTEREYDKPDYDGALSPSTELKKNLAQDSFITSEQTAVFNDPQSEMSKLYDNLMPKSFGGQMSEDIRRIPPFPEEEDGHFFFYFLSVIFILMFGYLVFHNKQKIIALIVEGRHERRRRSYGAGYKKLETK